MGLQLLSMGAVSANEGKDDIVVIESSEEDIVQNTAAEAVEITELNKKYEVIQEQGDENWFKFIPGQTDTYFIYTTENEGGTDIFGLSADKNLYGCIYDGNLNQIEYDSHYEDGDVQITASMSAGETYYIKVMHESPDGAGKFKLAVTEHHELQAYVAGTTLTESLVTVKPDQNKTLSVDVSTEDMSTVTYKWYEGHTLIEGAVSDSYVIPAERKTYACAVFNGADQTRWVYFTVGVNNAFQAYASGTDNLTDVTYSVDPNEGKTLSVSVSAYDTEHITYQWYSYDGRHNDYDWYMDDSSEEIEGATGSSFALEAVNGPVHYYCLVKDGYGDNVRVYFHIRVNNNLRAYAAGKTVGIDGFTVDMNGTVQLAVDVVAIDKSKLSYTWYKNNGLGGFNLSDDKKVENKYESTLTTDPITEAVAYYCEVKDGYGNTSGVLFDVDVNNGFTAYVSGTNDTRKVFYVNKNQPITLQVDVTANDKEGMNYRWEDITGIGFTDTTTGSFSLNQTTENKLIECTVTDKYGNMRFVDFQIYVKVFEDVKTNKFYAESVYWALDNGITTGTSATTFSPNAGCTRADFVTFLWRARGCPEPKTTTYFSDVKPKAYYYKAVMWAAEEGITTGYTGTDKFGAKDICKREQCVTFLYRAAGSPEVTAEDHRNDKFTDVKKNQYYYDAVTWAAKNDITTGISDTKFGVKEDCSRGQLVTFLQRYMKWYYKALIENIQN